MRSLAPLALPAYRRLLTAYSLCALGAWAADIALALLVLRETGSAAAVAAVLVAGQFVPALGAPALIAKLDSLRSDRVLAGLLAAQALLFVAQCVAAATFSLAPLLLLAVLDGVAGIPARSIMKSTMVATTEPAGLQREGNVLLVRAFTICTVAGPMAGAALVALLSPGPALLATSVALLAGALLMGLGGRLPQAAQEDEESDVAPRLRAGLAQVRGHCELRRLLLASGCIAVFGAAVLPVEAVFITGTLGGNEADFGLVLTLWGAGAVVGSCALSFLRRVPVSVLVVGAFLVLALSYAGMGLATTVPVVAAFSFLGGVANGVEAFAVMTALQERTTLALQARVNGLFESVAAGGCGLGFMLGGVLASVASARAVYVVAALGILVAAGCAAPRRERAARARLVELPA